MVAKRIFLVVVLTLMAVAVVNAQNSDSNGKQLRGAWKVTLTPEEGGPPPFPILMSFNKDGGVIETDQGAPAPGQPVSLFSTGLGEWQRVAKCRFIITYTQLQYDQSMNLIGSFRGRITADLDAEMSELTGEVTVEFFNSEETLVFSGRGIVRGRRLPVLGAN